MYSVNHSLDKFKEDDIFDTANPFYQLLEKQATEFELFGQRLRSEIQSSYREFMKFQQQQLKNQQVTTEITIDAKLGEAFEKISKDNFPTKDSQSELIDSLKARIEELETDSIIRIQDIRKQESEIQQLKQELNEFKRIKLETKELKSQNETILPRNDPVSKYIISTFQWNFVYLLN